MGKVPVSSRQASGSFAYIFNARIANYQFWFGHEKNGSILQKVSCWVLNTQALANHLNELHRVW
jgi:hypothetical protein